MSEAFLGKLYALAFCENACRISWAWELINYTYKDILCVVQAGQCRWPALSLFSVAGWRTRSTWRTCWTTSVTLESLCSFYCFLRAQTWLVRRCISSVYNATSPSVFGANCPHFNCFSQNVLHTNKWYLSYTFALTLLCNHNFQLIRQCQVRWPTQSFLKDLIFQQRHHYIKPFQITIMLIEVLSSFTGWSLTFLYIPWCHEWSSEVAS